MQVQAESSPIYNDDLICQLLDPALVKVARTRDMEYFEGTDDWEGRPLEET